MWRQTTLQRDEDPDQILSDDDVLDELGYDNDCTDRLHSLYRHDKQTSSKHGNEVRGSCTSTTGHLQSLLKEEHYHSDTDTNDESISDEDNVAVTENSLAYRSSSKHEEKYIDNKNIKCEEGFPTSKWNQVLEESSVLDSLLKKPINSKAKGKTKLKFSIHSNCYKDHELEVKNENSCVEEREDMNALNGIFDLLEDIKEEDYEKPSENIPLERKAENPSMAELLEGLQGKNYSNTVVGGKGKEKEVKKRMIPNLGKRTLEIEEDQPDSSSDDEGKCYDHLNLITTQKLEEKKQTMTDLFQEAFKVSNYEMIPVPANKFSGSSYSARLLEVMQKEKHKNAEFLRLFHAKHASFNDSMGITVQIISRALEGRLIVCNCLLHDYENVDFVEGEINRGTEVKKTVIFNSKVCDNVDLFEGNFVRIYPPWKEISVKEDEKIILCTYFSNQMA